jgi:hypothetical protein
MQTTIEPAPAADREHRWLWLWFALLVPATLLAFLKSYFQGVTFSGRALTLLVQAHAALMALWFLMLIGQALLIRTRQYRLHRMVGRSSFVVAPLIVVSVVLAEHEVVSNLPDGVTVAAGQIEVLGLPQVAGFAIVWALAILYRRRTALHARFMMSTAFAMGTAILARILLSWFSWVPGLGELGGVLAVNWAALTLMLLGLIAVDWRLGLKRSPFWVVTILLAAMHIGYWTWGTTEAWRSFLEWFGAMPL